MFATSPVRYHDDGGHIPLEGVYGRGSYGNSSSSIATVTSYRESDNTDDSDGYDFAETGIPNINNSTASNNSNLVFNPYSDVIGAEKVTREQMIYICEEYARIMAEENELLTSFGYNINDVTDDMDLSVFTDEELVELYEKITDYVYTGGILSNLDEQGKFVHDILGEDVLYRSLESEAIEQYEEYTHMYEELSELNSDQCSVFYDDTTVSFYFFSIGETTVVNLEEGYIAYYRHTGITLSLAPVAVNTSNGTITGTMDDSQNYEGLFLEGAFTAIMVAEGAVGLGEIDEGDERIMQTGGGFSLASVSELTDLLAFSAGISDYDEERVYFISD